MSDDRELTQSDERLQRLFDELPRTSVPEPQALEHLVSRLRTEGFFRSRPSWRSHWLVQLAAGIVLLVSGTALGSRLATRNSLESQLERTDLTVAERILLIQRAGSAYVRASNGYAGAVATTDSTAMEVARRVLEGAAQAVARSNLDGGLSKDLTAALRTTVVPAAAAQRVIWF
jgi:hypothetical protein